MITTEYKVFYTYKEFEGIYTEVFWGRTKDYAMALQMVEDIKEGKIPQVKARKIWIEEVKKRIIREENVD